MERTKSKDTLEILNPIFKTTVFSSINIIITLLLNFISRKLFLNYIGIDYLSVNQVISSFLVLLSFSEMGLNGAIIYMLYKPLTLKDEKTVSGIVNYFKYINRLLGLGVFGLGLCLVPFLNLIIKTNVSSKEVIFIYLLQLLSVVFTYLLNYKSVLLVASQKGYINAIINSIFSVFKLVLQCLTIILTKNYFYFLVVSIVLGLANNFVINILASKNNSYLKIYKKVRPTSLEKKDLYENMKSMFTISLSSVIINNTDNIIISSINTLFVGFSANYISLTSACESLIKSFHQALLHSIGNINIQTGKNEKYQLFKHILFANTFVISLVSICIFFLSHDFISIIFGKEYVLSNLILFSIVLKFYWKLVNYPILLFRDSTGLFNKSKLIISLNAITNIILSIFLGNLIGISGVYFATVLADIITSYWFSSKLVYIDIFDKDSSVEFNLIQLKNIFISLIAFSIIYFLTQAMPVSFLYLAIKLILCIVIYSLIYLVLNINNPEIVYFMQLLKKITNSTH